MKTFNWWHLAIFGLILISCKEKPESKEQIVAETVAEEVELEEENWITLFDGSNFDHWRGYKSDSVFPEWQIQEGAMVFRPSGEGGKNIITRETYENFVLSLEWKISPQGNSGIFYGVFEHERLNEAYESGPEIQVVDNATLEAEATGLTKHSAGALFDLIAPEVDVVKPVGEWNECVITIDYRINRGNVMLNGSKLYTFILEGDVWETMVFNSKFSDWKGFGEFQKGHIGLQDHGDEVWYRNIKIKVLE